MSMTAHPFSLPRRNMLLALGAAVLPALGRGKDAETSGPAVSSRFAASAGFRVPAETSPQQAVMLASPTAEYKVGWSNLAVQARMVRELIDTVDVVYLVNGAADARG